jgi:hypothetical protein
MSNLLLNKTIIKHGTFLYADLVLCDICIALSAIQYGSGDYEDPPEIAEDVEVETYYICFGSTTERGSYSSQSGGYLSLSAAITDAESRSGFGKSIKWDS